MYKRQALPSQLKADAQQIAQALQQGAIDIKTAQTQLDYLPKQQAMETARTNAQINATNRSNRPSARSSSGGSSSSRSSGSSSSGSSVPKPTSGANTGIKNIDDAVNGSYKVGEKMDMLKGYANELANQTGNNAAYLRNYVQQGIKKVEAERSEFVNKGRYSGAMDYYSTHAQ